MELGEQGIRVNVISPGGIATGIFGKALGLPTEAAERTVEKVKAAFARIQPIPRAGLWSEQQALWTQMREDLSGA